MARFILYRIWSCWGANSFFWFASIRNCHISSTALSKRSIHYQKKNFPFGDVNKSEKLRKWIGQRGNFSFCNNFNRFSRERNVIAQFAISSSRTIELWHRLKPTGTFLERFYEVCKTLTLLQKLWYQISSLKLQSNWKYRSPKAL